VPHQVALPRETISVETEAGVQLKCTLLPRTRIQFKDSTARVINKLLQTFDD